MHSNQTSAAENIEGAIWARLLGPEYPAISRARARSILGMAFPEEDKTRMRELAAKARAGTLTALEQEEVEIYSRVGSILGIMKSKARQALKKTPKTKANGTGL
jgi:hypothetical protein